MSDILIAIPTRLAIVFLSGLLAVVIHTRTET
jgi:hypothetical protein